MLGTHALPLFALTVLVVNATPGVDLMLTLTKTLQHGIRGGLAAAAGIGAGCVVHTFAAAFGLAALLAASASAFTVIKTLGALYLAWLAVDLWRAAWRGGGDRRGVGEEGGVGNAGAPRPARRAAHVGDGVPGRQSGSRRTPLVRVFVQALLTNLLNPKIAIFFLALLPQFIDADAPSKTIAFLFLGALFVVQGFAFLAAFVVVVARVRRGGVAPRVRRVLQAAGGTLFAALAARLALADVR